MKITVDVELQPFEVPVYVNVVEPPKLKQAGFSKLRQIPLSELDAKTLHYLCEEFRCSVFRVAGKEFPDNLEALNERKY